MKTPAEIARLYWSRTVGYTDAKVHDLEDLFANRDAEWRRLVEETQGQLEVAKEKIARFEAGHEAKWTGQQIVEGLREERKELRIELAAMNGDRDRWRLAFEEMEKGCTQAEAERDRLKGLCEVACIERESYRADAIRLKGELAEARRLLMDANVGTRLPSDVRDAIGRWLAATPAEQAQPTKCQRETCDGGVKCRCAVARAAEQAQPCNEMCNKPSGHDGFHTFGPGAKEWSAEQAQGEAVPVGIAIAALAKRVDAYGEHLSEIGSGQQQHRGMLDKAFDRLDAHARRMDLFDTAVATLKAEHALMCSPPMKAPPPPEAAGTGHAFMPGRDDGLCASHGCLRWPGGPIHAVPPIPEAK